MTISRKESNMVKGWAILMMLMHHFWNPLLQLVSQTVVVANTPIPNVEVVISVFCKTCVSVFAFVTGWVLALNAEKYQSFQYICKKLFAFLKDYWVIAIIFLLMGWLLGCNLPTIGIFILNLLGFEVGVQEVMGYDYVNVVFAWYVRFYLLVLLSAPFMLKVISCLSRHNHWVVYAVLSCCSIILAYLCRLSDVYMVKKLFAVYFEWLPCILAGYFVCRYKMATCAEKMFSTAWVAFIGMLVLIFFRYKFPQPLGVNLDFIYAFFLVIVMLKYTPPFCCRCLQRLGELSMLVWYFHGMFFIPLRPLQPLLSWTGNSFLSLLIGLVCSVIMALCFRACLNFPAKVSHPQ